VVDLEKWWKEAERPIMLQLPDERERVKKRERERAKRERADRRRLEKELKRLGWDSVEHFEADGERREWPPRG
jgi:uncharacterized protein (DUF58 family)